MTLFPTASELRIMPDNGITIIGNVKLLQFFSSFIEIWKIVLWFWDLYMQVYNELKDMYQDPMKGVIGTHFESVQRVLPLT